MDTSHGRLPAATKPPAAEAGLLPQLICLAPPRIDAFGQTIELGPRQASEPVQLLLRVAAAGPGGVSVAQLLGAMWPDETPRAARHRLEDCRRCLALLLGAASPPIHLTSDVAGIDPRVMRVDSLDLEEALAPLLAPFVRATPDQELRARNRLTQVLIGASPFLPGCDAPWADAARLRIADAVGRAARWFASGLRHQPRPALGSSDPGVRFAAAQCED